MMRDLDDVKDGRLQLAPGDTLVLFTDGVVEAVTPDDRMFGFDNLFESVATNPGSSAELVHQAVLDHWCASTGALEDDATMLVVRRQEAA
jgi:sigma-B regulation protein RsbU (phosphoserine phosphatase)